MAMNKATKIEQLEMTEQMIVSVLEEFKELIALGKKDLLTNQSDDLDSMKINFDGKF
jgi:hypothetical protein